MLARRSAYAAIVALPLLAALVLIALQPPLFGALRNDLFDLYQRIEPRPWSSDLPVRILDIDDASLARLGQWPWPRTRLAEMVERLGAAGAAVVGFDIVFSEPDRTSLDAVLPLLPEGAARNSVAAILEALPSNDDRFAKAIAGTPSVLGMVLTQRAGDPDLARLPVKFGIAAGGDDPRTFLPDFSAAVLPLPAFSEAAAGVGALNWLPDRDQVVRQVPLLLRVGEQIVPSLATEALRVAQDASTFIIRASNASGASAFGASTGIVAVKIGAIEASTDPRGEVRVRVGPTEPRRFIPAWKLLAGEVPQDEIAGRIILVGTSAAGLLDVRATPIDAAVPGVEIQAQLIEHLVSGASLSRPDWATGAELVATSVLGIAAAVLLPLVGVVTGALLGGLAMAGIAATSWYAFTAHGVLVDPIGAGLAVTGVYLAGVYLLYHAEQRQKRWVRQAFGHFVSPAVVEQLAADPKRLVLGGEIRTLTVMFSDVRGFTSISESMTAEELTRFMNRYLTPMTDAVLEANGTVDKYVGDAIMAFWNAPLDDADHAANAAAAVLAMYGRLAELNDTLRREAQAAGTRFIEVRSGIGLATGDCCVGNLGSSQRFDYSALGDTVNIASRLEGATKFYRVSVLATETTRAQVQGSAWLEVDLTRVKGRAQPVRIFTLVGDRGFAASPGFAALDEAHGTMLACYRGGHFDAAAQAAERAAGLAPAAIVGLYDLYRERCRPRPGRLEGEAWDYVTTLEEK
ncbi:MAG TPA: adenylate/guanylate cyclase domain-containing protein [Xanthobacteraceae bacterium]|nr:adenylate/guanylate cyclase domain-containing protein [Xanthobacteraceae bacterium]